MIVPVPGGPGGKTPVPGGPVGPGGPIGPCIPLSPGCPAKPLSPLSPLSPFGPTFIHIWMKQKNKVDWSIIFVTPRLCRLFTSLRLIYCQYHRMRKVMAYLEFQGKILKLIKNNLLFIISIFIPRMLVIINKNVTLFRKCLKLFLKNDHYLIPVVLGVPHLLSNLLNTECHTSKVIVIQAMQIYFGLKVM